MTNKIHRSEVITTQETKTQADKQITDRKADRKRKEVCKNKSLIYEADI